MGSISILLGYLLNLIYGLVKNYGIAIILFSILLKLLLLPLSIKQHKNMKKTAKIQVKMKEIQEKYKNDQVKMNQEMMDLYKKENMSPFSGCLSSIIQIIILLAVFGIVRNPLTNMLHVEENVINNVAQYIKEENGENSLNKSYPQISVLQYVEKNKDEKEKIEVKENEEVKEINLEDLYINMDFLGLDLSNVPQENMKDPKVFIIPILYVLTSIVSMKMTTNMNKSKEKKEVIELNKEKKEESPEDMTAQMSKSMTMFMPLMTVSISLIAPLGLALYWLVNNILMIVERIVLNKVFGAKEETENE